MVRIITDTSSDLTVDQANEIGVILLPMTINIDGVDYKDRYELPVEEFYDKLEASDNLPTTCQVNPFTFEEEYKKAKAAGDQVIVITLSGPLSGTYQSALMASEGYEDVYVIDTLTVAVAQQCAVRYALMLRDKGLDAKTIYEKTKESISRLRVMAVLDTLEYLKKGGRISPTTAWAGALLNIKPVVTTIDGVVSIEGKARGSKNAAKMLNDLITNSGGADMDMPIVLGYTGNDKSLFDQYLSQCCIYNGQIPDDLLVSQIGSTVATHVGPGAIAVGYFTAK